MRIKSPKAIHFLLSLPVVGFLAVVDPAAWTLILILSLPMVMARYFPSKLDSTKARSETRLKNETTLGTPTSFSLLPVHLFMVAIAIFLLNASPEKLNEQPCSEEMALTVDERPTSSIRDNVVVISSLVTRSKIKYRSCCYTYGQYTAPKELVL